ncbi:MAG: magnesium transporter CorA family protein [Caulobacteraceae bacterium]
MLTLFPPDASPASAIWIDLLDPSEAERDQVRAIAGAAPPSRAALSEIEAPSRIRIQGGVLSMNTPSAAPRGAGPLGGQAPAAPIGFMLSKERLITVRFAALPSFETVSGLFAAGEETPASGLEVFIRLCEEIIDRIADGLEHLAADLDELSQDAFHVDDAKGRQPIRSNRLLRVQLRRVGRLGDRLSQVRDSLLGLARVTAFTAQNTQGWPGAPPAARLASLTADIASLNDYEAHLSNKVQFLLDAMVGLIGIAQNDIFKVLTIVSIVGISPTLVASIYGMNFKNMPELHWVWGYPWGLAMILLSAIVPVVWFKIKGWF